MGVSWEVGIGKGWGWPLRLEENGSDAKSCYYYHSFRLGLYCDIVLSSLGGGGLVRNVSPSSFPTIPVTILSCCIQVRLYGTVHWKVIKEA